MLRPSSMMEFRTSIELLARLCCVPQRIVHDTQMRHLHHLPGFWRVRTRETLAGFWILDHLDAVKNEQPDIGFVIEEAASALEIAVDRRGAQAPPKGDGMPSLLSPAAIVRAD